MERSDIQVLIDAIATGEPNTALKVRTVLNAIADGTAQTGDVKEIDVSNAYLNANFDVTGLGINERLGWAICNGQNGTRNRSGRVAMAYDATNYATIGAIGGSKDAVVVTHSHGVTVGNVNNGAIGGEVANHTARWDSGSGTFLSGTTEFTGVSGTDKNLQPYMVTLMIMKL